MAKLLRNTSLTHHTNLYFTGNCTKNELPRAESLDIISWTCQGKFGIIRLNCSCIETNSTSQASQACCDAQITKNGDREEIHQGGRKLKYFPNGLLKEMYPWSTVGFAYLIDVPL